VRTTLNIDEALLADFKQIAARSHRSLSAVIQDALRESLLRRPRETGVQRVELPTFGEGGTLPGVDLDDNLATRQRLEGGRDDQLRRAMSDDT